ncbi:MAG: hypothetical protein JXA20_09510 [Spirochaetes bacterium]|nr:hypothetical protein [Spirochaetota bacterium]
MRGYCIVLICCIAGTAVRAASAQEWERNGPPNPYNARSEITVKGTVERVVVMKVREGNGTSNNTFLRLGNGIMVYIGPNWYIGESMVFAPGDRVAVRGARMLLQGISVVAAKQVRKGATTLVLRDYEGRPYWDSSNAAVGTITEKRGERRRGKGPGGKGGGKGGGMGGGMDGGM